MLSFQFSFDDYEEAETALAAFAETCRQLKSTLKKRKPAGVPTNSPISATAESAANKEMKEFLNEQSNLDTSSGKPAADKPEKAPRGSKKSADAKLADAVNRPTDAPEEKKTVLVTAPSNVTIEHLRAQVAELTSNKNKGGVLKVAEILKSFGSEVKRLPDLPEDAYPKVFKMLAAAITGDAIPY
jgi:hypothetical protein